MEPAKSINIGVASHIAAASLGGKRYDKTQTQAQRKSIHNGIWLCQSCSKLIDSDEQRYTVELLQQWKIDAENRALQELETNFTENKVEQRDAQTALLYQTEISYFLSKFKTCLHWTLPVGKYVDQEIDNVFNYGSNFAKQIDLNSLSKALIITIFTKYDFTYPMVNFIGEKNFHPTGFHNLLGILDYLKDQLEKHLNKYGGSISTELASHIEYTIHVVKSTTSSIRLDLKSQKHITTQTISLIADLILLIRDDFQLMKLKYTKNIAGGFPVLFGKVTKSHKTDGEIIVETQFSNY